MKLTTPRYTTSQIEQIIQNYLSGISLKALSEIYGGTTDKIRYCLQQHNIWTPSKPANCHLPEQEVVDLYKNDVSVEEIAKKYETSVGPVVSILNKHKVRKPNRFKSFSYERYLQFIDKDWFIEQTLLCDTQQQLADMIGCSIDLIRSLYKIHNIPIPTTADTRLKNRAKQASLPFTVENVKEQHLVMYKPLNELCEIFNVSPGYLRRWMDEQAIESLRQGETKLSKEFREVRNDRDKLVQLIKDVPFTHLNKQLKVSQSVLRKVLRDHSIEIPIKYQSVGEKAIAELITTWLPNETIILCDRKTISPLELDIYLPEKKIAIEYCGLYWHCELQGKDRNYHINKLNKCNEQNITLLTIFEDEWYETQDQVITRLKSVLGMFDGQKINARQCDVGIISPSMKQHFLDQYHLQQNDKSTIHLGLFYQDMLVAVMTFSTPSRARASKTMMTAEGLWELNRYATHSGYRVRGGAGKLLSYFKSNYQWNTIYSYADRRWSEGKMYHSLGFEVEKLSAPNYWYVPRGYYQREYRFNYTKYVLIKQGFDPNKSEWQIMQERGYTRIWDCGMIKFVTHNQ